MHRTSTPVRRGLAQAGLTAACALSLSLAAQATGGGADRSPWTPPVLDVGVDLSTVKLQTITINRVSKPAEAFVGPQLNGPAPAGGDHDHDGDGVQDHSAEDHPAGAAATLPPGGAIKIVNGDAHDFGALVQGAVVEHDFVIESAGEQALIISSIRASCGCTVATSERIAADGSVAPYAYGEEVAPGEQLRITARLNTDGKKNNTQSSLTVISNDPAGSTQLRLSAQVTPFFTLEPNAYINFGEVLANQAKTETVRITSAVADAFMLTLEQPELIPDYLAVELRAINPDETGRSNMWDVTATIGPGAPE
ncbi:MAG: DUF1573 domain-containing protein, partial [Planctomycetota bacterium]